MARYIAEIQGSRGKASRLGSKVSGIWSHARGWDLGIESIVRPDPDDKDRDYAVVSVTAGSNGRGPERTLATVDETPNGRTVTLYGKGGRAVHTYTLDD